MGFIKFLGTAGARFVMIRQLRSSGGIWVSYKSTNLIIDPGPGSLLRCLRSRPPLDPLKLDGIIMTHKHLDHSGDINVMIEAMSQGGFKKRGVVFAPEDSFGAAGVVFSYLKYFPERIEILKKGSFHIKDIAFEVSFKNLHSVDTYGVKLRMEDEIVSFVSDTRYTKELIGAYKDSTILILNVVFYEKRSGIDHLCLQEAVSLVKDIRPREAFLTHFGTSILRAKPHELEKKIRRQSQEITFARDGMTISIPSRALG